MLQRRDWTLLVLAAAGGQPLQPVQLQKTLFLIGENLKPVEKDLSSEFYDFEPYDYGPFDRMAYADAEYLSNQGFATITTLPGRLYREYAATVDGLQRAKALEQDLARPLVEYVHSIVDWARSLSFSDLVRAIYQQYPEQRVRSVFNL